MKYKTCISIGENTPEKIRSKLKVALKKSDYVEIRLDFLKSEQVPKTLEIIKKRSKQSCLYTKTKNRRR